MLPNNLLMLNVVIEEHQRDVRRQYLQTQGLVMVPGPMRRMFGRFLIWSGHQVGGKQEAPSIDAQSIAPVLPFSPRQERDEMDIAA